MARVATVSFDAGGPLWASDVLSFDLGHADGNVLAAYVGDVSIVPGRTGNGAMHDVGTGAGPDAPPIYVSPTGASGDTLITRHYFKMSDLPDAGVDAEIAELGPIRVFVNSDGRLIWHLNIAVSYLGVVTYQWPAEGAHNVPGGRFLSGDPLAADTWYRLELLWRGGSTDKQVAVRLDGVVLDTYCGFITTNQPFTLGDLRMGWGECFGAAASPGAHKTMTVDDVAINDDTGDDQNGWPGPGAVYITVPEEQTVSWGYGTQRGTTFSQYNFTVNGTFADACSLTNPAQPAADEDTLGPAAAVQTLPPADPILQTLAFEAAHGYDSDTGTISDPHFGNTSQFVRGCADPRKGPSAVGGTPHCVWEWPQPRQSPAGETVVVRYPAPVDLGCAGPLTLMVPWTLARFAGSSAEAGSFSARPGEDPADPFHLYVSANPAEAEQVAPLATDGELYVGQTAYEPGSALSAQPEVTLKFEQTLRNTTIDSGIHASMLAFTALPLVIEDGFQEQDPLPDCDPLVIVV